MNAAMDALHPRGITQLNMPLSPHRVWAALRNARP
jgi:aerobic carbon-monoxide dehydrogenase large subunit